MRLRLHRFTQHTGVSHAAVIVYIRVARKKGNRIIAMLVLHRRQLLSDSTKGLFPADLSPAIALLFNRHTQTIGVCVDILHRSALGADITSTERVILITLNRQNLITLSFNLKATDSFTKVTGAIMDLGFSGHLLLSGI